MRAKSLSYPQRPYKNKYARVFYGGKQFLFKDYGSARSRAIFETWRTMLEDRLDAGDESLPIPTVDEATRRFDAMQLLKDEGLLKQIATRREEERTITVEVAPPTVVTPEPAVVNVHERIVERVNWTWVLVACIGSSIVASAATATLSAWLFTRGLDSKKPAEILIDKEMVADHLSQTFFQSLPADDARRLVQEQLINELQDKHQASLNMTVDERRDRIRKLMKARGKDAELQVREEAWRREDKSRAGEWDSQESRPSGGG